MSSQQSHRPSNEAPSTVLPTRQVSGRTHGPPPTAPVDVFPRGPVDPLGLSLEDQVLRPLAHELVLSSADLGNTALISRHNGSPPWFEVHTFHNPPAVAGGGGQSQSGTAAGAGTAPSPISPTGDQPLSQTQTRRVTRIRRRPHHRQPNDGDVLCLLVGVSDTDRDMTIQFAGQAVPVKVRKFFKKGLINSDVYAFADARGNRWEWRERRYGYDFSLHEADKPDYQVIARYTSGIGTNNRPYLEYSPQGHIMLDLVVATFFALENSIRAINSRPSMMRALSKVGAILRSPGAGEGSRYQPASVEEPPAVAPEPLLPPIQTVGSLRTSMSMSTGTPPPHSPAGSTQVLSDGVGGGGRRSMQRQRD